MKVNKNTKFDRYLYLAITRPFKGFTVMIFHDTARYFLEYQSAKLYHFFKQLKKNHNQSIYEKTTDFVQIRIFFIFKNILKIAKLNKFLLFRKI